MKKVLASAPGKIHLLGEHSVVYGKPALLAALSKRVHVEILENDSEKITLEWNKEKKSYMYEEIIHKTTAAQEAWKQYEKDGNIAHLKNITLSIFDYAQICLGEAFILHKITPSGITISITSDIPFGSGFGSSASLAISLIAAVVKYFDLPSDLKTIQHLAYLSEKRVHGNPSGADVAVALYGGIIFFQSLSDSEKVAKKLPFFLPTEFLNNLYVTQTGKPAETTGEMVAHVRKEYSENKDLIESFLNKQEVLTLKMVQSMEKKDESEFITCIKDGEQNLEAIGVVSEHVMQIIRLIEKTGGVAKICGGGGKAKNTGVLLVYHKNFQKIQDILSKIHLSLEKIELTEQGLSYE